jgi:hypothetical protein
MSALDKIIDDTREDAVFWRDGVRGTNTGVDESKAKQLIKDLFLKLIDDEQSKLMGDLRKKVETL